MAKEKEKAAEEKAEEKEVATEPKEKAEKKADSSPKLQSSKFWKQDPSNMMFVCKKCGLVVDSVEAIEEHCAQCPLCK